MSQPRGRFARSKARQRGQSQASNPHPLPALPPHGIYIDRCIIICKFRSIRLQIFEKLGRVKFLTIAKSLKDIKLGLERPTESFPSIKLHSVAGWEYACLSQKTVEGRFLKSKLWKKLEIFFIPDPATVNVHEKTPIWQTWCRVRKVHNQNSLSI